MPIAYGLVDIRKATSSEKTRPHSQIPSLDWDVHGADASIETISHRDTVKDQQCSLCYSESEVCLMYRITRVNKCIAMLYSGSMVCSALELGRGLITADMNRMMLV